MFNAKAVAEYRKALNDGLNYDDTFELAYSPEHNTVGCRCDQESDFRIFNTEYPLYGHSERVTDWVSVGIVKSKKRI
jgi:hypothetical protein